MIWLISFLAAVAMGHGILWWQHVRTQRASRSAVLPADAGPSLSTSWLMRWTMTPARLLASALARHVRPLARWYGPGHQITSLQLAMHSLLIGGTGGGIVAMVAPVAPALCGMLAACVGSALPWIDVRCARATRQRELEREWERMLELLALALDAGLELFTAVAKIFDQLPPSVLRSLMEGWYREIRLGRRPETAWRNVALQARVAAIEVSVALLVQALRFGTPVAAILRSQARMVREARLRRAEHAGAVASHKLLLPVMVCMIPAYFLLTFGGILVRLVTGTWEGLW